MEREIGKGWRGKVVLEQGDIRTTRADAIANAANERLAGGGGVDGAIHDAGGPAIMKELDEIRARRGGCPTGSAVPTTAGKLAARWVFHAVGPRYHDGKRGESGKLASAYRACLELAEEKGARTIAFPSISTGVYGYPVEAAAKIALETVAKHLSGKTGIERVTFVLFNRATFDMFTAALARLSASRQIPPP